METKIKYVARDGREFTDPEQLAQYEQALDTDHNTIEYVVRMLSSLDGFVTGIVICEHGGQTCSQPFVTVCVDDWLKDFVDVDTLTQEQRYIDSSTRRCAAVLRRKFSREDLCQYILLIGRDVKMSHCEFLCNCHPLFAEILRKKSEVQKRKVQEDVN